MSKTKEYTQLVNKKPEPANTPAEVAADARLLLTQRAAELETARDEQSALDARLDRGDDSVTAESMNLVGHAVRRAEKLLEHARAAMKVAVRAANKARAQDAPTLAELLRDIAEEHVFDFGLFGFPIEVVRELPKDAVGPAVFLYQEKATEEDHVSGLLAGEVKMAVVVPKGVEVNSAQIEAALEKHVNTHRIADVEYVRSQAQSLESAACLVIVIRLRRVKVAIPTIVEDVSDDRFRAFAQDVAQDVVNRGQLREAGVSRSGGSSNDLVSNIHARAEGHLLASAVRDGDTMRRVVEVTVDAWSTLPTNLLGDRITRTVEQANGEFAGYLGRIEKASVARIAPAERHGLKVLRLAAEYTFVSVVPDA
ncbi:hypothetical protein [Longispora urticae]